MTKPADATHGPQADQPNQPRGRYRFQGGRSLDPDAGVHPEMASGQDNAPVGTGIPNSPQDLIAMQSTKPERPKNPEHQHSPKVKQVLELLKTLETGAAEDQQIAVFLVRQLEEPSAPPPTSEQQEALAYPEHAAWAFAIAAAVAGFSPEQQHPASVPSPLPLCPLSQQPLASLLPGTRGGSAPERIGLDSTCRLAPRGLVDAPARSPARTARQRELTLNSRFSSPLSRRPMTPSLHFRPLRPAVAADGATTLDLLITVRSPEQPPA